MYVYMYLQECIYDIGIYTYIYVIHKCYTNFNATQ